MKKTSIIPKHRFPTVDDAIKLYDAYLELNCKFHLPKRQFAKHLSDANFNKELHLRLHTNMTKFAVVDNALEILVDKKLFSDTNILRLLIEHDSFDMSTLTSHKKHAVYQLKSSQATLLAEKFSKYSCFVLRRHLSMSYCSSKNVSWSIFGVTIEDFVDEDTGEVVSIRRLTEVCRFTNKSLTFISNYRDVKKTAKILLMLDKVLC